MLNLGVDFSTTDFSTTGSFRGLADSAEAATGGTRSAGVGADIRGGGAGRVGTTERAGGAGGVGGEVSGACGAGGVGAEGEASEDVAGGLIVTLFGTGRGTFLKGSGAFQSGSR